MVTVAGRIAVFCLLKDACHPSEPLEEWLVHPLLERDIPGVQGMLVAMPGSSSQADLGCCPRGPLGAGLWG